jgi:hypothetical protein
LALFIGAPICALAKGSNEYRVSLQSGVLLNSLNVSDKIQGSTGMKNTFQQSVGVSYARVKNSGLIFSVGGDFGYERYDLQIDNYPYRDNWFYAPAVKGAEYRQKKTISYAQVNLAIGYRLKSNKLKPEIRVGQLARIPLGYKVFEESPQAINMYSGYPDQVLYVSGVYGKNGGGLIMEFVNYVYLGCAIPADLKALDGLSVGINVQRQMYLPSVNQYNVNYYNAAGILTDRETFAGKHFAISLQINLDLK